MNSRPTDHKPTSAFSHLRRPTGCTPLERVAVLMDMLDERRRGGVKSVTVPAWLARLGLEAGGRPPCEKTLHRDAIKLAKLLREQNGGREVLAYNAASRSWSLAFPVPQADIAIPTCTSLVRTDGTVTTLFLARRAAEQFSHTPMFGPMQAMLDQKVGELPPSQRKRLERLAGQIHFTGPAFHPLAPEIFEPVLAGLDLRRQVEIGYRNPRGIESRHTLSPLGLVVADRAWHVVAVDSQSGEIRDFRLSRILDAALRQAPFTPPKDFDLPAYLRDGFGGPGHAGEKAKEVVLRFTPEGAAIACDDMCWHPTQKRKTLDCGGVELRFKTTALFQVAHQVMAHAGHVEVIAPQALRASVRERANVLAGIHG